MSPMILVFLAACFWLGSVTPTPVLNLNSDQAISFKAGKPFTVEELNRPFSSITRGSAEEYFPWEKQDPRLVEGDIKVWGEKNAIIYTSYRWPKAIIPYIISDEYTTDQREIIAFAMGTYHNNTCIRFVPRTCETNYIRIYKSGGGCYSYVGLINRGVQDVSLDDGCLASWAPGIPMHELMHAAGFFHEHSRPDRDSYVSINLNNVLEQYRHNFDAKTTAEVTTLGLAYDYGSVMHYPRGSFAIDSTVDVITPLIGTPIIGQRAGFSSLDLQKLNKLYNCNA
ncbi:hatching enzyme 1.2-like isoform X2 [Daphnia carinata]|uniref:hatching enzyme 1.2-like isoform X2 n=1 Tax=Daphnia carinata TaxID=120202 RepID=UPI002579B689|nr:hatching enzyme 1.2-like isoform X2 [Daphnia carinata]